MNKNVLFSLPINQLAKELAKGVESGIKVISFFFQFSDFFSFSNNSIG